MPSSIDNPLFPGEYVAEIGDAVFIEAPAGLPEYYVMKGGDGDLVYTTVPGIYGVPTALGIYFHAEPLSSVTRIVFSAVEAPMIVEPGEYTILVKYEVDYLRPRWFFSVFPAGSTYGGG